VRRGSRAEAALSASGWRESSLERGRDEAHRVVQRHFPQPLPQRSGIEHPDAVDLEVATRSVRCPRTRRRGRRAPRSPDPRHARQHRSLFIAPSGVWVVDAKAHSGRLECRDSGSLFRPRNELYVGGRNRTQLAKGVEKQVECVRAALRLELDAKGTPAHGALCFVEADGSFSTSPSHRCCPSPKSRPSHARPPARHSGRGCAVASFDALHAASHAALIQRATPKGAVALGR
jgi:hypothetical protein